MFELKTEDQVNESYFEQAADHYLSAYPEMVNVYESHCQKAKAGIPVTTMDIANFGRHLDIWEQYHNFCESTGSLGDLGPLPNIALDVIAAVQTQSILPLISSSQTLDEIQGTVYAKRLSVVRGTHSGANGGLGGLSEGQELNNTLHGQRIHDPAFGGGRLIFSTAQPLLTTTTAEQYTVNTNTKLLPQSVSMTVDMAGDIAKIMDDGEGQLLSTRGIFGTVNYTTGVIVVNFESAPTAGWVVVGTLDVDVEREDNMVTIATGYEGVPMKAEFFGLKSESGLLSNFAMNRRWGKSADDDQAQDLTNELVNTMNAAGVQRIVQAAAMAGNVTATWGSAAPTGVSSTEHKLSFIDTLSEAERNLMAQAGRGKVNRMLAGASAAAKLRAMPDFVMAPGGNDQQVGLYGYLGGTIPVIRGVDSVIGANEIKGLYMGTSAFDAPMVNGTYLPLFVTSTLQVTDNPLRSQRAVATMTGLKVVVPNYIANMAIS